MKKENFFVHIVCNVVIAVVLLAVFGAGIAGGAITTFMTDSKAIYRGNSSEANVSLMFNVYQGEEYIDDIIATLAKYNAKATFFVGGMFVARHTDVAKRIAESGNEIGNHGYSHKDAKKITYRQNYDEIALCEKQLATHGIECAKLFAPPSGSLSDGMHKAAEEQG